MRSASSRRPAWHSLSSYTARTNFQHTERNTKNMSLIRYQTPDTSLWRSLDRWANLRDEFNNLFEGPYWPSTGRQAQLFSGWTPALDLYQTNDDVVAVVELPGMRKEDIEISLHDGMLTISGERKDRKRRTAKRTAARSVSSANSAAASRSPRGSTEQSQRLLQGWHPDRHSAESGGSQTEANPGQRRLIGRHNFKRKETTMDTLVRENRKKRRQRPAGERAIYRARRRPCSKTATATPCRWKCRA